MQAMEARRVGQDPAEVDLGLPARLVEEALTQDDQHLRLDEICAPGSGSAGYSAECGSRFAVECTAPQLPVQLHDRSESFMQEGVLPEIQHMWRSFDSTLVLWRYSGAAKPEVLEYVGVTQQIVSVAVARPKAFVSGVDWFLVIATPVEVSLHALCLDPATGRLQPPVRTQHFIATDDVVVSAVVADSQTGRIFLGGHDGCIHELQYFDDEPSWFGRQKRCRKVSVQTTVMAHMPMLLRKVSEKLFGPPESIVQLVVDSVRDLLLALSSTSTVTVFRLPPPKVGTDGRLEEVAPVQLCTIDQMKLSSEVAKVRMQLFPGLAPSSSRFSGGLGFGGGGSGGSAPTAAGKLKIVRLLPLGFAQGGNIVACAVAEDGTRLFLRGVFKTERPALGGFSQEPASGAPPSAADGPRPKQTMTQVVVHHVRFLDVNGPIFSVKDAVHSSGNTLLLCKVLGGAPASPFPAPRAAAPAGGGGAGGDAAWSLDGAAASDSDVVVAISTDMRAVAQRQSRGQSPWLAATGGLAEHVELLRPSGGAAGGVFRAVALASSSVELPEPVLKMYGSAASRGVVLPVLALSELAQQQLLPAQQFVLISNLGVHSLTKVSPVDDFKRELLRGDIEPLKEFTLQYTGEQTCALCFQLLTGMVVKPAGDAGALAASELSGSSAVAASELRLQRQRQQQQRWQGFRAKDVEDEALLLRAEHLLLAPQLSAQLGLVQTWPALDAGTPQMLSTTLGHSVRIASTSQTSPRIRGLCLYLSRILRPLWLAPVMSVAWPGRPAAPRKRPRGGEWWPPPPEPSPMVHGAKWQCAWTKQQRNFVQGQLAKLAAILERCKDSLAQEDGFGRGSSPVVSGLATLIATSVEALAFLELIAPRAEYLGACGCPADSLVRFSELTFRDLVCQPEARGVLQQLMRGGVVACRQLHAKCPRLFSAVDLEVQEAYELLEVVRKNLMEVGGPTGASDVARWSHLVQQPLRTLERHAARVDLAEAAARCKAVGACKGLVALCSRIARARDPSDESLRPQDPSSARTQQLFYARAECYQAVLEVFEGLYELARHCRGDGLVTPSLLLSGAPAPAGPLGGASGGGAGCGPLQDPSLRTAQGVRPCELPELLPVAMRATDAAMYLDAMLRHCLEGHAHGADQLFHHYVFKWMMQRELPVYRYDSPYLKGFLQTHAREQPELLCRYYQHRGRWAEACDAYMALVSRGGVEPDGEERSRTDKLVLLQSAALCARMPGSCRRVEPILQAIADHSRHGGNPQEPHLLPQ